MVKKFILAFSAILLALFFTEVVLRFTIPQTQTYKAAGYFPCYTAGTYYWAEIKPNSDCILHSNFGEFADMHIKTNSQGLRNPEVEANKPNGTKRILFIGDSFTFGWGVNENNSFSRLTQEYLNKKGLKVESINAGRPSNSPGNYYLYLMNRGLKFDPDIVVVGFDVLNDVSSRNEIWLEKDSKNLPTKIGNSNFYVDPTGNLRQGRLPFKYTIPVLKNSLLFSKIYDVFYPPQLITGEEKSDKQIVKDVKTVFKEMNSQLKKRGKKLVILMIPLNLQVDSQVRKNLGLPPFIPNQSPIGLSFINYFKAQKIEYIDLLPEFLAYLKKNDLYYKQDGHFNYNGHNLTAKILTKKLQTLLKK